jgi:hypothetical protein
MKIGIKRIALPPNNMELTGRMRHAPCERKSKGHAAFVLQLMYGRSAALDAYARLQGGATALEPKVALGLLNRYTNPGFSSI